MNIKKEEKIKINYLFLDNEKNNNLKDNIVKILSGLNYEPNSIEVVLDSDLDPYALKLTWGSYRHYLEHTIYLDGLGIFYYNQSLKDEEDCEQDFEDGFIPIYDSNSKYGSNLEDIVNVINEGVVNSVLKGELNG